MNIGQIRELKFNRLKPDERFLFEIFDGLIVEESLEHKGEFLYIKDNYCYFYHQPIYTKFYYDHTRIFTVFKKKFNYNLDKTDDTIKLFISTIKNLKQVKDVEVACDIQVIFNDHLSLKQFLNYGK